MIEDSDERSVSIADVSDSPMIIQIPVKIGDDGSSLNGTGQTPHSVTYSDPGDSTDDAEETARRIAEETGVEADETLIEAVRCAAHWRALGADTLIYVTSYGATMVANGLVIRFLGAPLILSCFLFNLAAVIGFPNATILFNSLLHPPKDDLPEEQRKCFEALKKYGLLPLSWMIRASLSGSAAALLRDTRFSTQQTVSAVTSAFVGPIMYGLRAAIRPCMRGSIKLTPQDDGVAYAFKTAYSAKPNPRDKERPYRWSTFRDIFIRVVAMSSSTVVMALTNGFNLQAYCINGQDELLNITNSNRTITFEDISTNCAAGPFTFLMRDMGIAFVYGIAMLVLEPVMNVGLNKIFDCFYCSGDDLDDSDDEASPSSPVLVVEVDSDDDVISEEDSDDDPTESV